MNFPILQLQELHRSRVFPDVDHPSKALSNVFQEKRQDADLCRFAHASWPVCPRHYQRPREPAFPGTMAGSIANSLTSPISVTTSSRSKPLLPRTGRARGAAAEAAGLTGRATEIALWGTFARRHRKSSALRNNIEPLAPISRRLERPSHGNRDVPLDITVALVCRPGAASCAGKSEYTTRMAPATRSLAIRGFRGGWRSARTALVTLR